MIHATGTPSSLVMSWAQVPENPQQMPPSAAKAMPRATWLFLGAACAIAA